MNVIFVCTKAITFNTFLNSQANFLSKKGFKIGVVCSDVKKLNIKNSFSYTINFPLRLIETFNIFKYIKIFFQINNLIKKYKSSIFYLHTPVASHIFRFFSLFYDLKIIYFVHGFRFTSKTKFLNGFFFKVIEKLLSYKNKVVITINYEDYDYANKNLFYKVPIYKINGIGIDLNQKNANKIKFKKKIKKIIVIAAYKNAKGYFELIKVAQLIKKKNFEIDCYGYGDSKKFKDLILQKKLTNITFKKFDKNLSKKITNYDLLLHLSKREGLPVSVMECLSQGIPVVCYQIRGNKDLISDGFNGFFIKSYKEVPYKIYYLNLENQIFHNMRINSINSITKDFSKIEINKKIYNIIKKNFNK